MSLNSLVTILSHQPYHLTHIARIAFTGLSKTKDLAAMIQEFLFIIADLITKNDIVDLELCWVRV